VTMEGKRMIGQDSKEKDGWGRYGERWRYMHGQRHRVGETDMSLEYQSAENLEE
jgi:hypothetical protein